MGYEVMPFKGTRENVLRHVPRTVPLTVTASPQKGLSATVKLAAELAGAGYRVAPHLSARLTRDKAELQDFLGILSAAGISSLFVVGGDGDDCGAYKTAHELLVDIHESGFVFGDIGIAGYPEGHPLIGEPDLTRALSDKAPLAHHITTQMCFDIKRIRSWAAALPERGVHLPVRIGIPGAVSRQKLMRIAGAIGLGDSARFLRKQQQLLWRFFLPGGYNPGKIVRSVAADIGRSPNIAGFHVFTFNDLGGTERWRQSLLRRAPATP
ncbi:5,10-methylenetetrahydrofolate reductase [Amycolatopsis sp. K13G38]|uniref:Methylenetetrahydrofolate reductase n=2 Tax=Amycolatopsis acididurans TaxID=2724524 RepID=A0ABX1J1W8_9PSEU|nr:5,10-methylenetetrahydrofolate reductase [Amycolatopsis acididurans]